MPIPKSSHYAVLGMLSLGPRSGYEIRRELAESIGAFWNESYGQIYPALRELSKKGLARRHAARRPRGPARFVYEITPKGRDTLRRWLAEPPRATPPRNELLLKLFFMDRDGVDAPAVWTRALLAEETERLRHVRRMKEQLPRGPQHNRSLRFWMMTLEYVEKQSEATAAWCQRTIATLDLMQEALARRRTAAQRRSPLE
ncbi:MAG TPA: PadR family transcriptional regulator [Candidatus Eisenbacteria bacterium]|nr:PadR family transcriptional regulator [Candidatus Eisenbacteria bacterium]